MPSPWLLNYWSKTGKLILPYLKYRKLGVAVPLKTDKLANFNPNNFTPEALLKNIQK